VHVATAVAAMRATGFPDLDDLVVGESLLRPADPEEVTAFFERAGQRTVRRPVIPICLWFATGQ
jgi:hypothetical protein